MTKMRMRMKKMIDKVTLINQRLNLQALHILLESSEIDMDPLVLFHSTLMAAVKSLTIFKDLLEMRTVVLTE